MIASIRNDPYDKAELEEPSAKDGYLVQQANIYVTQVRPCYTLVADAQHMVRYLVIKYKEDLLALHQTELCQTSMWMSNHAFINNNCWLQAERQMVVHDLVQTMQVIPTPILGKCLASSALPRCSLIIATNSVPLIEKVRVVAVGLLDVLSPDGEGRVEGLNWSGENGGGSEAGRAFDQLGTLCRP